MNHAPRHLRRITRCRTHGLTAVELAIAVAVIITATLLYVRQRRVEQHRQLQAAANANPAQVFAISMQSEHDPVAVGEPIAFVVEVHNPTQFPLELKWGQWFLKLTAVNPSRLNGTVDAQGTFSQTIAVGTSVRPTIEIDGAWRDVEWLRDQQTINRIEPGGHVRYRLEGSPDSFEKLTRENAPGLFEAEIHVRAERNLGGSSNDGSLSLGLPEVEGTITIEQRKPADDSGAAP
jgi:hypothetical protein